MSSLNRRRRKKRRLGYLVYLLILIAGAYLIYTLIPQDVLDAIKSTYWESSSETEG